MAGKNVPKNNVNIDNDRIRTRSLSQGQNMGNNISNPRSRHLTTPTPMICLTKTMTVPKILLMEYQKKKMRVKIQKQWIHEIINMINSTQANDGKNLTFNFYHL